MPYRRYARTDPRRYAKHAQLVSGRKGTGLLLLGLIWTLIGRGVLVDAPISTPGAFHENLPAGLRGTVWMTTGALAVASVFSPRLRGWALGGLMLMPTLRLTSYLWAWLMDGAAHAAAFSSRRLPDALVDRLDGLLPPFPPGDHDGWYRAAFPAVMLAFVVYIAGEIEPPPRSFIPPAPEGDDDEQEGA